MYAERPASSRLFYRIDHAYKDQPNLLTNLSEATHPFIRSQVNLDLAYSACGFVYGTTTVKQREEGSKVYIERENSSKGLFLGFLADGELLRMKKDIMHPGYSLRSRS